MRVATGFESPKPTIKINTMDNKITFIDYFKRSKNRLYVSILINKVTNDIICETSDYMDSNINVEVFDPCRHLIYNNYTSRDEISKYRKDFYEKYSKKNKGFYTYHHDITKSDEWEAKLFRIGSKKCPIEIDKGKYYLPNSNNRKFNRFKSFKVKEGYNSIFSISIKNNSISNKKINNENY